MDSEGTCPVPGPAPTPLPGWPQDRSHGWILGRVTGGSTVARAQWWLAVCHSTCAAVQPMPSHGGTAAIPCFRCPGNGHSRVSSRHRSCNGTGAIFCSSCPGKGDTGAGSGLVSSTVTSTLDTRKNCMPAGPSLGGTGEVSDPLEGWYSTGASVPAGLSPGGLASL